MNEAERLASRGPPAAFKDTISRALRGLACMRL
jgi:hypothetical protein